MQKSFIHVSVRLNKSVKGHMALGGYFLGPCSGESCCHWCFCELQRVIVSMQKRFIHVSVQLNESVWGQMALCGLLSEPLYKRKLLSLVFMWTLRCNSFKAKRFIHVSFRLNNAIWVWPFGATVWSQVQEKIAVIAIFIKEFTHEWYATIFICVLLQLKKWIGPLFRDPQALCTGRDQAAMQIHYSWP